MVREKGKVIICADPDNMVRHTWTGWTEEVLDKLSEKRLGAETQQFHLTLVGRHEGNCPKRILV